MMKQLLRICALPLVFCLIVLLPGTESGRGHERQGLLDVPIRDTFGLGFNNLRLNPGDFTSRHRTIYRRRPGYRSGRRGRYRPENRYYRRYNGRGYEDVSDEYYPDSPETYEEDDRYYYRDRPKDACSYSRSRGTCSDLRSRWYYNEQVGKCHRFTYSGCGGNRNNFVSRRNCEDFCAGGHKPGKHRFDTVNIEEEDITEEDTEEDEQTITKKP